MQSSLIQVLLLPFYYFLCPWSLFFDNFFFLIFFPFFSQELYWWKHFLTFILLCKLVCFPLEWQHYLMRKKHSGRSLDWYICSRCKQRFSHKLSNIFNLSLHAVFKNTKKLCPVANFKIFKILNPEEMQKAVGFFHLAMSKSGKELDKSVACSKNMGRICTFETFYMF